MGWLPADDSLTTLPPLMNTLAYSFGGEASTNELKLLVN